MAWNCIARRSTAGLLVVTVLVFGCQKPAEQPRTAARTAPQASAVHVSVLSDVVRIDTPTAEFALSPTGYLRGSLKRGDNIYTLDDPDSGSGQQLIAGGKTVQDFVLDLAHAQIREPQGKLGGTGKQIEVTGRSASSGMAETVTIKVYDDFPGTALLSTSFRNDGSHDMKLDSVSVQEHRLNASLADPQVASHDMWAFFGSSLQWGKDEVLRIPVKFTQQNPFSVPVAVGEDLGAAGGGIPVVAFWNRNAGEAIGHVETLPLVLSIPVRTLTDGRVSAAVEIPAETELKPGEVYSTPRTFLTVYAGDYYEPLQQWSKILSREGLSEARLNDEDYAVSWCSWGYRANITPKQMLDTIPKLKEIGIHWATLDDRWYNNYGDWKPREDTFPGDSMRKLVNDFHAQGIKVQIWWLPIAVEDGQYNDAGRKFIVSDVVKKHPGWLILDRNGKHARMTRNLAALCPALPEVQTYYKQLTEQFIRDWDFDGHKLDNIFATPQCFNPKHNHKSPNDSVYAMGEIYKTIFETTRALKPNSVTQSCPCGTPPSLAWFRYMDQAVTADPIRSVQVRRRVKMYKALLGPQAAVYGDHVELTRIIDPNTPNAKQIGVDFASTLGTGGVPGTKFTLSSYKPEFPYVSLDPEKEAYWKKWIAIYNDKMLSKGEFLNLYTYGYDTPEAYAIRKDGNMFYAFYDMDESPSLDGKSGKVWTGEVELRGLDSDPYRVVDYANDRELGMVQGPVGKLKVQFAGSLLLEARPTAKIAGPDKKPTSR